MSKRAIVANFYSMCMLAIFESKALLHWRKIYAGWSKCKYEEFQRVDVNHLLTKKGKVCLKDQFHFQYTLNRTGKKFTYWRCSDRSCSASIATCNVSGKLVSSQIPDHHHGNKLIKDIVKATEKKIIMQHAKLNSDPSTVQQEIS